MNPLKRDLCVSHRNLLHPGSTDKSIIHQSASPSCHQPACVDRSSTPMTDSMTFDVVLRVPQPYYTSLSAVTRPLVVPRPWSKDGAVRSIASAPNILGARRRTTSPGCIRPLTSRSCGMVEYKYNAKTPPSPPTSEHHSTIANIFDKLVPGVPLSISHQHMLAESQENILFSESPRLQSFSVNVGKYLQTAVDFSVECENNLQQSDKLLFDKHEELISSMQPCNNERNITEPTLGINMDLPQNKDKYIERSRTLPAGTHLKYSQPAAVSDLSASQKSRSLSFANFLRRVSPKSIRRLMSLATTDNQKFPVNNDNILPDNFDTHSSVPAVVLQDSSIPNSGVATASKKSATRSPLRKWFDRRKSKDHPSVASPSLSCSGIEIDVGYRDDLAVDSVCFNDDTAMLRTCCSDVSSKISVADMAVDGTNTVHGLPLQIVEFPDNLINAEQCSPIRTDINVLPCLPATGSEQSNCNMNRSVGCCTSGGVWRLHDPPASLDIRPVCRLPCHFLQFPCSSIESIGQCSLDISSVTRVGSETSLIKNSLPSSATASQQTLTSHDSITAVHEQVTDLLQQQQQYMTCFDVTDNAISGAADDLVSSSRDDDETRSPLLSYLQLSHCAGGYSTFTSYAPYRAITEHRNGVGLAPYRIGSVGGSVHDNRTYSIARSATSSIPVVSEPQHCRFTPVDDVVTDVNIIPRDANGRVIGCAKRSTPYQNGVSTAIDATTAAATAVLESPPTNGSVDALPTSVNKDGSFFLQLVDNEQRRLLELCSHTEYHLQNAGQSVHEEVEGKIRSAVGKANLLTSQKFQQFRQLCSKNLCETGQEPFCTTDADLAGFWDTVLLQVADVDRLFCEVDKLRLNDWKMPDVTPSSNELKSTINSATSRPPATRGKPTPHHVRPTTTASVKSAVRAESRPNKSREEARSRLMAAKLAGRQRKASDSEKDVEIFVS